MSSRLLPLKTAGDAETYINPKAITAIWLENGAVSLSLSCGKTFTDLPYKTPKDLLRELGERYREAKQRSHDTKHKHHEKS